MTFSCDARKSSSVMNAICCAMSLEDSTSDLPVGVDDIFGIIIEGSSVPRRGVMTVSAEGVGWPFVFVGGEAVSTALGGFPSFCSIASSFIGCLPASCLRSCIYLKRRGKSREPQA